MNFVYLLTNETKSEGRRFYVGSKTEALLTDVDGVSTIINIKTGRAYYGSSTCPAMKEDMLNANTFSAKILEEVPDKKNLLSTENKWIIELDAVNSPEYYNLSYAVLGGHMYDQTAPINKYGETIKDYGKAKSSINNKNNTAKSFGFKHLGEFSLWVFDKQQQGLNGAQMAEILKCERHIPIRYTSAYNLNKCAKEWADKSEETEQKIRNLVLENVSIKKIAELLGLEIPTVVLYVDVFDEVYEREYLTARRLGKTKDELELIITRRVVNGEGLVEVSKDLGLCEASVKRYFLRYVRKHLILPEKSCTNSKS